MTYDPQAQRQRLNPTPDETAAIDALLGNADSEGPQADSDGPQVPVAPAVTPDPADPPPDKLLLNSILTATAGVLLGAILLRWALRRCLKRKCGGN